MTDKTIVTDTMPNSVVEAYRYDFDGYGWRYIDSGSGSDWKARAEAYPDAEALATLSQQPAQTNVEGLREAVAEAFKREGENGPWQNTNAEKHFWKVFEATFFNHLTKDKSHAE